MNVDHYKHFCTVISNGPATDCVATIRMVMQLSDGTVDLSAASTWWRQWQMLKQAMKDNHPMVKVAAALAPIDPKPVVYDGSKVTDDEVVSMEASGLHVEMVPITSGMPTEFHQVKLLSTEDVMRMYPKNPNDPDAN